jgi:hypothetical protein
MDFQGDLTDDPGKKPAQMLFRYNGGTGLVNNIENHFF